ncbi:MAG: hypothetical protein LAP85_06935 [Acidobacteriia bacterium]|nr:hypothetical protein [Terriglobia bacterium]
MDSDYEMEAAPPDFPVGTTLGADTHTPHLLDVRQPVELKMNCGVLLSPAEI